MNAGLTGKTGGASQIKQTSRLTGSNRIKEKVHLKKGTLTRKTIGKAMRTAMSSLHVSSFWIGVANLRNVLTFIWRSKRSVSRTKVNIFLMRDYIILYFTFERSMKIT